MDQDFIQTAGKIEGIGRTLLLLIANLEENGVVNGEKFTSALRDMADSLTFNLPHLEATKSAIRVAATTLDDARFHRQTKAN